MGEPVRLGDQGSEAVLGVDACKGGWVGVRHRRGEAPTALVAPTIDELVTSTEGVAVVAIDIPIGLPEAERRRADQLARQRIGPRASSVFTTPPRAVLDADSYQVANERCRALCGFGISQQAYALGPKILEVDNWVRRTSQRVVEVHPEVSFATLAGWPLPDPKSTWAGAEHRRALLADAGLVLDDLDLRGARAAVDDVLDAAVAAWTAHRVIGGVHESFPDPPQPVGGGLRAAIVA